MPYSLSVLEGSPERDRVSASGLGYLYGSSSWPPWSVVLFIEAIAVSPDSTAVRRRWPT